MSPIFHVNRLCMTKKTKHDFVKVSILWALPLVGWLGCGGAEFANEKVADSPGSGSSSSASLVNPASKPRNVSDAALTGVDDSVVFDYTGTDQTWTVPAGVTSLHVKMWGAGGGSPYARALGAGGGGAFSDVFLPVTPGEVLTIIVGGGGAAGNYTYGSPVVGAYGGGGAAGAQYSAGGGGR